MKYILTFIFSIFIFFGLAAIVEGVTGFWNIEDYPEWEKTEAILKDVEFLDNQELKAEYEFEWNNKKYTHSKSEQAKPDTGRRNMLQFNFEYLKIAHKIFIWVNPKNTNESSFFPVHKNYRAKFKGLIQFGIAFLVLPIGMLIFIWILDNPERDILNKIEMIN